LNGCNAAHLPGGERNVVYSVRVKSRTLSDKTIHPVYAHYSAGELKDGFLRRKLCFVLHDRLERCAHVGENQKPLKQMK